MVADTVTLDEARRASGAELLKLLDGVAFGAVGAAWVYSRDVDRWHYLLITSMVDTKGPQWIYERLLKVFTRLRLPDGITPLDIVVASSKEQAFVQFPFHKYGDDPSQDEVLRIQNVNFNGFEVDAIFLYRFRSTMASTGDGSRKFDLKVRQLLAA